MAWQTYPCIKGGEYLEFTGIPGKFYTFTFCMAGGGAGWDTQITLLDASGTPQAYADDDCFLESHLTYWMCTAPGTYRVLVTRYNCASDVLCGTMAYKMEPDPGGPGVTCGNPYVVSSLPFSASGFSTCGFGDDYSSANACASTYMNDEDFVFRLSLTAGQCISIFMDNTFTYTGLFLVRGCPNVAGSTCIASNEASAGSPYLSNITVPTTATYYIIVSGFDGSYPDCTPFDIEIMNCVAVGQGANCATAFTIPSIPYSQNGFTTCGRGNTYTSAHACGSTYMNGEDFVFRYNSPGNECISINVTNTFSYTGVFVLNGCPNVGGTACLASRGDPSGDPELRTVNLVAPGTYYIVVSTWPTPNCTPFNMVIEPCGPGCTSNPNAGDNCAAPTAVTIGLNDTICGVSNFTFTPDFSPDLDNDFCGSIENNSWFSFVADSTQLTLQVDVPSCMSGFGLQTAIFQTNNCNTFTPLSNCWNPQYQTNGVMQATGLTVGATYYLMIDGYAGDDCEYRIYRLGQFLPVTWGGFTAVARGKDVHLDWSTLSETNSAGFNVQRGHRDPKGGKDAMRWSNVEFIRSVGDASGHTYNFVDTPEFKGEPWYYRIQQVDHDGNTDFTDVIEVLLEAPDLSDLRAVYPNPANTHLSFQYFNAHGDAAVLALYDLGGRKVRSMDLADAAQGLYTHSILVDELPGGLYFYTLTIGQQTFKGKVDILH